MLNSFKVNIPNQQIQDVQKALDNAITILKPLSVSLTPEEKRKMHLLGTTYFKLVEKAHSLSETYPQFIPSFEDKSEYDANFEAVHRLMEVEHKAKELIRMLSGTQTAAGREALRVSLEVYHSAETAMRKDIPGSRLVYEELRPLIPQNKKKYADQQPSQSGSADAVSPS
jgi:hypothetical protein